MSTNPDSVAAAMTSTSRMAGSPGGSPPRSPRPAGAPVAAWPGGRGPHARGPRRRSGRTPHAFGPRTPRRSALEESQEILVAHPQYGDPCSGLDPQLVEQRLRRAIWPSQALASAGPRSSSSAPRPDVSTSVPPRRSTDRSSANGIRTRKVPGTRRGRSRGARCPGSPRRPTGLRRPLPAPSARRLLLPDSRLLADALDLEKPELGLRSRATGRRPRRSARPPQPLGHLVAAPRRTGSPTSGRPGSRPSCWPGSRSADSRSNPRWSSAYPGSQRQKRAGAPTRTAACSTALGVRATPSSPRRPSPPRRTRRDPRPGGARRSPRRAAAPGSGRRPPRRWAGQKTRSKRAAHPRRPASARPNWRARRSDARRSDSNTSLAVCAERAAEAQMVHERLDLAGRREQRRLQALRFEHPPPPSPKDGRQRSMPERTAEAGRGRSSSGSPPRRATGPPILRVDALLGRQDPVAGALRRGRHHRPVHGLCACVVVCPVPRARLRERQAGPAADRKGRTSAPHGDKGCDICTPAPAPGSASGRPRSTRSLFGRTRLPEEVIGVHQDIVLARARRPPASWPRARTAAWSRRC